MNELMGGRRGVDVENEIGRLANHFVAEVDGKPEVNHALSGALLEGWAIRRGPRPQ
jgi:hypothetical protein